MKKIAHEISSRGFCSRRDAEKIVLQRRVKVDGLTVLSCAERVDADSSIIIDGKSINAVSPKIFLLHKPVKYLTSHKSQKGYKTVFDLIKFDEHLTYIGRLDYMSEGLVILTNTPSLVSKLSESNFKRRYEVQVDRIEDSFVEELENPVLFDCDLLPIKLISAYRIEDGFQMTLELSEGKNREIRRLCDKHYMSVLQLKKIQHGPFKLLNLRPKCIREVDWDGDLESLYKSI